MKVEAEQDVDKNFSGMKLPGNFLGFLSGTNFAPIANAIGGPNIKPRASIPGKAKGKLHE